MLTVVSNIAEDKLSAVYTNLVPLECHLPLYRTEPSPLKAHSASCLVTTRHNLRFDLNCTPRSQSVRAYPEHVRYLLLIPTYLVELNRLNMGWVYAANF
jgi:hypothetical protein